MPSADENVSGYQPVCSHPTLPHPSIDLHTGSEKARQGASYRSFTHPPTAATATTTALGPTAGVTCCNLLIHSLSIRQ